MSRQHGARPMEQWWAGMTQPLMSGHHLAAQRSRIRKICKWAYRRPATACGGPPRLGSPWWPNPSLPRWRNPRLTSGMMIKMPAVR